MVSSIMDSYSPLMRSLINVESSGNPNAISSKGARGLAQIMPATGRDPGYGILPLQNDSPEENVRLGNDYLMAGLKRYNGNQRLALAGYNSGFSTVDEALRKANGDEVLALQYLPSETQAYVPKVLAGAGSADMQSNIMPMAASFQQQELPPGQAAEAQSRDTLSELIAEQKARMKGNRDNDQAMMMMNFASGLINSRQNLGGAIAEASTTLPKTIAEQQAQNNKNANDSLTSRIEIEKFKQEQAIRQQNADSTAEWYGARAKGAGTGGTQAEFAKMLIANGVPETQAVMIAKNGLPRGYTVNEKTGQIELMSDFSKANATVEGDEKLSKDRAEMQAKAQGGLGNVIENVGIAQNAIDKMIGNPEKGIPQHKGLNSAIGTLDSKLPTFRKKTADFENLRNQVQGQAFLDAYSALRGTGQITEIEGTKATEARSRMQSAASEEEFIKAAQEFYDIVERGKQRAIRHAKGDFSEPELPSNDIPNLPAKTERPPLSSFMKRE